MAEGQPTLPKEFTRSGADRNGPTSVINPPHESITFEPGAHC
jgi:hypothetical protein